MDNTLKIISYNARSLQQATPLIMDLASTHDPDVICIQETRATTQKCTIAGYKQYRLPRAEGVCLGLATYVRSNI